MQGEKKEKTKQGEKKKNDEDPPDKSPSDDDPWAGLPYRIDDETGAWKIKCHNTGLQAVGFP